MTKDELLQAMWKVICESKLLKTPISDRDFYKLDTECRANGVIGPKTINR